MRIKVQSRWIGEDEPTYFIADISANHDGDLERAKRLIRLAKESGADAAKFQHFRAPKIVSDYGFKTLGRQQSHQASWKKSVYEVYQAASLPWEWTETLKACANDAGIHFFSAPYDLEAVDMLAPHVPAYKIGSGDVSWPEIITRIASKGKPVFLAVGASDLADVSRAVNAILPLNRQLVLMQCNTNYTGSGENFSHLHLNALKTFRREFPDLLLGLSDHTPGHSSVLAAVALGARVIEKHFTDDQTREGPDHPFSMTPATWREMVARVREVERALGSAEKFVAENERETVVLQRRCLRAARDLAAGETLRREDVDVLRPAPRDGIFPYDLDKALGRPLRRAVSRGDHFRWADLG